MIIAINWRIGTRMPGDESVYHLGASLKDLGKKMFAFSRFAQGALELLGRLSHV